MWKWTGTVWFSLDVLWSIFDFVRRDWHCDRRLEFPPAQRPVQGKMRWDVLARGALLKLILVFLKPQSCFLGQTANLKDFKLSFLLATHRVQECFGYLAHAGILESKQWGLGLLAASKKAQEDFHKSWSRELDLKDFRSRGGLQSFHKFLGRPIWKEAQTLRMPKDARLGLSYRWPNSSMSLIEKCFPDLQELDLSFGGGLFGGGLVKWLEESSTRLHFSQSFAKLTSLKLHVYDFQEADMLVSLTKLRRLHLGLLGTSYEILWDCTWLYGTGTVSMPNSSSEAFLQCCLVLALRVVLRFEQSKIRVFMFECSLCDLIALKAPLLWSIPAKRHCSHALWLPSSAVGARRPSAVWSSISLFKGQWWPSHPWKYHQRAQAAAG